MSQACGTLFPDLPAQLNVEQLTDVFRLSDKKMTYPLLRDGVPIIRLGSTWVIFRDDITRNLEASNNIKSGSSGAFLSSADEGRLVVDKDGVADEGKIYICDCRWL